MNLTTLSHAPIVVGASVNPGAGFSRPIDLWRTPRRKPRVRFSFERACVRSLTAAGSHRAGLLTHTLPARLFSRGCAGFKPMEPKMQSHFFKDNSHAAVEVIRAGLPKEEGE